MFTRSILPFFVTCFVVSAFCQFLTLIMYGSEVGKVEESKVTGTFALPVLSMLLDIGIPALIYFDKKRRFNSDNVFIQTGLKRKSNSTQETTKRPGDRSRKPVSTIEGKSSDLRRSASSLSEADTYRRFAYLEVEPSADPSTVSIGSATSLNTRSEAHTQVSYLTDNASIESAV